MNAQAQARQSNNSGQASQSLLARLGRIPFRLLGWLVASLIFSLLLEWVLLTLVWYEEGASHSQQILQYEQQFIGGNFTQSEFGLKSPSSMALSLSSQMYYWLFIYTGLDQAVNWMGSLGSQGNVAAEYIGAAANVMQLFILRLSITTTSLPLFCVFAYWGAMEGLIRRELRRHGADYERGMVYHYAKYLSGAVFVLPILLYLTIPISVNPAWVFVPFAGLLGLVLMVYTATFTKYI